MNFINEPIVSRKIAIKSMTRHFAGWKTRFFTLDRTNQVLEVVREKSRRSVIELRSASITMGRHHYSADGFYWYWIRYFNNTEGYFEEIIMKFEQISDLERWEQALKAINVAYQNYLHESIPLLLDILGGLINEKVDFHKKLSQSADDEQEGAYYKSDGADDVTPASGNGAALMDSFMIGTVDDSQSVAAAMDDAPSTATSTMLNNSQFFDKNGSTNNTVHFQSSQHAPTTIDTSQTMPLLHSAIPIDTYPPSHQRRTQFSPILHSSASSAVSPMRFSPKSTPPPISKHPYASLKKLSMPKLNILIMAVGTRGDIQPFRQFGMRLMEDGHRVRLATHELFRSYVLEKGLEFYPLAGDPVLLSEFMVKTGGSILPLSTEILKEVPKFHAMICDIVASAWKACLEPDPQDEAAKPFAADVIISNPVTYAHCHCAEALGIPLHLMFPQPWVPTKAFPHPLSRMSYTKTWQSENYVSYEIIDRALWLSFERDLNQFRVSVGLEPFRLGQYGWNLLNYHQVPFVKMWSPSIVPKPKDWPAHVDIVGSFFDIPLSAAPIRNEAGRILRHPSSKHQQSQSNQKHVVVPSKTSTSTAAINSTIKPLPMHLASASSSSFHNKNTGRYSSSSSSSSKLNRSRSFDPKVHAAKMEDSLLPVAREPKEVSAELLEFLEKPGFIIYVGFGSMVVPNLEELVALFLEAAALTNVRLLFQQGWSKIDTNRFELLAQLAQEKAEKVQSMLHPVSTPSKKQTSSSPAEKDKEEVLSTSTVVNPPTTTTAAPADATGNSSWLFSMIQTAVATATPLLAKAQTGPTANQQTTGSSSMKIEDNLDDWDEVLLSPSGKTLDGDLDNTRTSSNNSPSANNNSTNTWNWENDAFYMAECPHTWLFQQVSAVVHHGGAGTTSTGLRYGRPTWICPFFGDQFFWGEMVHRGKLGPKPCPVGKLHLMEVVTAFEILRQPSTLQATETVSVAMAKEDGVENAVRAFYQHLPLEHMICEVSLMMNMQEQQEQRTAANDSDVAVPTELAEIYCVQCGLKMTQEIADILHQDAALHMQDHELLPCCYFDWSVPKPESAMDGVVQGVGGYVHEFLEGVADVVYDPVSGGYENGLQGAATGLVKGLNTFVDRQLQGGSVLVEKIMDGVVQQKHKSSKHSHSHSHNNHPAAGGEDDEFEEDVSAKPHTSNKKRTNSNTAPNVQSVTHVASEWLRAGATVLTNVTQAASSSSSSSKTTTTTTTANYANSHTLSMDSPTTTTHAHTNKGSMNTTIPTNSHISADQQQQLQQQSTKKKPVRYINHRTSAKNQEVRLLRTQILQQIRRIQTQQQNQRLLDANNNNNNSNSDMLPGWSREQSSESVLVSQYNTPIISNNPNSNNSIIISRSVSYSSAVPATAATITTTSSGYFAGYHQQSILIHNSSSFGASLSSAEDSAHHHHHNDNNNNNNNGSNDDNHGSFPPLPPPPAVFGTPTRRHPTGTNSNTTNSNQELISRAISVSLAAETILERSRESEETPFASSPRPTSTSTSTNNNTTTANNTGKSRETSVVSVPAILCQGSVEETLRAAMVVQHSSDPFENDNSTSSDANKNQHNPTSDDTNNDNYKHTDDNSNHNDSNEVSNMMRLPSPLPPLTSSALANNSFTETTPHNIPNITNNANNNSSILEEEEEEEEENNHDEDEDDMPFLLKPPTTNMITITETPNSTTTAADHHHHHSVSPPNLLSFSHFDTDQNTANTATTTTMNTMNNNMNMEPSLLDVSYMKFTDTIHTNANTTSKPAEYQDSHDLLGLLSTSFMQLNPNSNNNNIIMGSNSNSRRSNSSDRDGEMVISRVVSGDEDALNPPPPPSSNNDSNNDNVPHDNSHHSNNNVQDGQNNDGSTHLSISVKKQQQDVHYSNHNHHHHDDDVLSPDASQASPLPITTTTTTTTTTIINNTIHDHNNNDKTFNNTSSMSRYDDDDAQGRESPLFVTSRVPSQLPTPVRNNTTNMHTNDHHIDNNDNNDNNSSSNHYYNNYSQIMSNNSSNHMHTSSSSGYVVGIGFDDTNHTNKNTNTNTHANANTSHQKIPTFPSFPSLLGNNTTMPSSNNNHNNNNSTNNDNNNSQMRTTTLLSSSQTRNNTDANRACVTAAFQRAKDALFVFTQLSGGSGSGSGGYQTLQGQNNNHEKPTDNHNNHDNNDTTTNTIDNIGNNNNNSDHDYRQNGPVMLPLNKTRIWSERRFAQVLQQAIARYATQRDTQHLLQNTTNTNILHNNSNNNTNSYDDNDDDYYYNNTLHFNANNSSANAQTMFMLEETIVRRPEHREALFKHLLKSITRDHTVLTFVDFALLYRSLSLPDNNF